MIVDSNNETHIFPHKLLSTDRQVPKLCKDFTNNSSANIKLSKTQFSKIVWSGGFFGRLGIGIGMLYFMLTKL